MKVINTSKKPFHINVKDSKYVTLIPGGGAIELPTGYDEAYITALEKQGKVKTIAETKSKTTKSKTTTQTTTEE